MHLIYAWYEEDHGHACGKLLPMGSLLLDPRLRFVRYQRVTLPPIPYKFRHIKVTSSPLTAGSGLVLGLRVKSNVLEESCALPLYTRGQRRSHWAIPKTPFKRKKKLIF